MTKIIVALAEGFEEMEAIIPINVWRRAGFEVVTTSITDNIQVTGSHQITILADKLFNEDIFNDADMIFLPGGIPGSNHLDSHKGLQKQLLSFAEKGMKLGAICAAPLVLGHNSILKGKKATCYPGFEKELYDAEYTAKSVQVDGNIITGKGAGVALEYALEVVKQFKGEDFAEQLAQKMQVNP